jgi:hypothetical protein
MRDLNERVQGCVAELVFNLDEVRVSDWEDVKARKVVLPATMARRTIHHAVSWNVKHISAIACVSTAEESFMVYIVTSQNSSPVQEPLGKQGVCLGRDLVLKSNHRPYVNAEIFLDYIEIVF